MRNAVLKSISHKISIWLSFVYQKQWEYEKWNEKFFFSAWRWEFILYKNENIKNPSPSPYLDKKVIEYQTG